MNVYMEVFSEHSPTTPKWSPGFPHKRGEVRSFNSCAAFVCDVYSTVCEPPCRPVPHRRLYTISVHPDPTSCDYKNLRTNKVTGGRTRRRSGFAESADSLLTQPQQPTSSLGGRLDLRSAQHNSLTRSTSRASLLFRAHDQWSGGSEGPTGGARIRAIRQHGAPDSGQSEGHKYAKSAERMKSGGHIG